MTQCPKCEEMKRQIRAGIVLIEKLQKGVKPTEEEFDNWYLSNALRDAMEDTYEKQS